MENTILIVDDDETVLETVRKILSGLSLNLSFASNGLEAIQLIDKYNYSLLITDLSMPNMDGFELLNRLNKREQRPTSIVLSNSFDLEKVVELIKGGVFDYLTKPIESKKLISAVSRGIEHHFLNKVQMDLDQEKHNFFLENLEWENYRKKLQRQSYLKNKFYVLDNIRTSFSQGVGFGSLDAVIQRIQKKAKKVEGYYQVPESLMELLFENAKATRRVLNFFEDVEQLNSSEEFEEISLQEIHSILLSIARNVNLNYAKIKKQSILISEKMNLSDKKFIKIERKYFEKMITEIFLNALKFSVPNSKIFVLCNVYDSYFEIACLNSPEPDQNRILGIPDEYSELIFEPFFRMSKFVYEAYPTLDFGLGLTFVERAVQKYGGKISARNVKNHIPFVNETLTLFELQFKLL